MEASSTVIPTGQEMKQTRSFRMFPASLLRASEAKLRVWTPQAGWGGGTSPGSLCWARRSLSPHGLWGKGPRGLWSSRYCSGFWECPSQQPRYWGASCLGSLEGSPPRISFQTDVLTALCAGVGVGGGSQKIVSLE